MPFKKSTTIIFSTLLLPVLVAAVFSITTSTRAQISPDAIAIRVLPNPEHYSARRWYQEQGFNGSPQTLVVDGYEAVRDGRTVYVDVANIYLNNLYTNIYLISYNQRAERATRDIFAHILSNWRFNANVNAPGHCRDDNNIVCYYDNECPNGNTCDSSKARITRDTRRLADLTDIQSALDDYYNKENRYPNLPAGTYLPAKSLSVWPSWLDTLSGELGRNLPLDPVNKLGSCPGFNEITCWNQNSKQFAADLPDLPDSSLAYHYYADSAGIYAHLCAVFESGYGVTGVNLTSGCPEICLDFDGDGYGNPASGLCGFSALDCDDTNPAVGGGSPENCSDGIDNDCDGLVDCDDGDCAGSCSPPLPICNHNGVCDAGETCVGCPSDCCGPPACPDGICDETSECLSGSSPCLADCYCGNGTTECGEECDDGNTTSGDGCSNVCTIELPPACIDGDGDAYDICNPGDPGDDGKPADCNDSDGAINPAAPEICDGIDNNCNGSIDEGWSEETCGFVCSSLSSAYNYNPSRGGDLRCCGDDAGEGNPYESPEFSCFDGHDNDCDGFTDLADSDCSGVCSNTGEDDWINAATPGDCNQCDYEGSQDDDQFAEDWSPYPGMADQCDSDCGTVATTVGLAYYENGTEITCNDGFDNDCDGQYNCNDSDCAGNPACCTDDCTAGSSGCVDAGTRWFCGEAGDGDPCLERINVSCLPTESCSIVTGLCVPDCTDADGDGYFAIDPINCSSGNDCDDSRDFIFPGNPEACDGYDNNCNGSIDEGCDDDGDSYCDSSMLWFSTTSACPNTTTGPSGDDCEDRPDGADGIAGNADDGFNINPGASEICDGLDNDCDLSTLDGSGEAAPLNFKQAGICAGSVQSCTGGSWVDDYSGISGYEDPESTCNDGIDNDCDGQPDCSDSPDCDAFCSACHFTITFPCTF